MNGRALPGLRFELKEVSQRTTPCDPLSQLLTNRTLALANDYRSKFRYIPYDEYHRPLFGWS